MADVGKVEVYDFSLVLMVPLLNPIAGMGNNFSYSELITLIFI